MNIPNVEVIVQWKATCTMSMLWQRFGCAGCNPALKATAVFLVEKDHFDKICKEREEKKKWKVSKSMASSLTKWPHHVDDTWAMLMALWAEGSVDVKGSSDDSANECGNQLEEMCAIYLQLADK